MISLAFILFGSTSLVVLQTNSLSTYELIFLRFLFCSFLCLPLLKINSFLQNKENFKYHFLTSISIFLNMVCLFESFKKVGVSVATAIFYTAPVMTLLLKNYISKNKTSTQQKIAIAFGALGLVGICQQGYESSTDFSGYLLALTGGFLFSLIPIFESKVKKDSPIKSLFIQSFVAILLLAPLQSNLLNGLDFDSSVKSLILGIMFTFLPFVLWWQAIRKNPNVNPLLAYLDPVTAILIGFLFYGETFGPWKSLAFLSLLISIFLNSELNFKNIKIGFIFFKPSRSNNE